MKRKMIAWMVAVSALTLMASEPVFAKGDGVRSHARSTATVAGHTSDTRARASCKGACSTAVSTSAGVDTTDTNTNANGVSVSTTSGGTSGTASTSGSISGSVSGNSVSGSP